MSMNRVPESNSPKVDTSKDNQDFIGFSYRYTNYYLNVARGSFLPIEFDYYLSFEELLNKYSECVKDGEEYDNLVTLYGLCNI
jgi:hypothetical protein